MDRIWLTRTDRIETITRGAAAGLLSGALLAVLETTGAVLSGTGPLTPWRMVSSLLLDRGAFTARPEEVLLAGIGVHVALAITFGIVGSMLLEWSAWTRTHRSPGAMYIASASFGALVWLVNFPIVASAVFPWIWRLDQAMQLLFHVTYGVGLGLSLTLMGKYARNPPDSLRPA